MGCRSKEPSRPKHKADWEMADIGAKAIGNTNPAEKLASMSEVECLLRDGTCSFTDLEPIRNRYEAQFGDELCWSFPFCDGHSQGGVFLPVREGILYLPYNGIDTESYEQFVLEDLHLMDRAEAHRLQMTLDSQYTSLAGALKAIQGTGDLDDAPMRELLGQLGAGSSSRPKSALEQVLEQIDRYVIMQGFPVTERLPINDLNRDLIRAMAEEHSAPIYLGSFYSDELTPYVGQDVRNFQYNFCLPVNSEELKKRLRAGIGSVEAFDQFYQLLCSLGGHPLLWA